MKKFSPLFCLLFFLCSAVVLAQPPFQTVDQPLAFTIQVPTNLYSKVGVNFTFHSHVYNFTGKILDNRGLGCTIHMYDSYGNHIFRQPMIRDSDHLEFYVNISTSLVPDRGQYPFTIFCNNSLQGSFVTTFFQVTENGQEPTSNPVGLLVIPLLPMILAAILLFGATQMNDDHSVLKAFIFMVSIGFFYYAFGIATTIVTQFYDLPATQEIIAGTVFITNWVFILLIMYHFFHLIILLFKTMASNREEGFKY